GRARPSASAPRGGCCRLRCGPCRTPDTRLIGPAPAATMRAGQGALPQSAKRRRRSDAPVGLVPGQTPSRARLGRWHVGPLLRRGRNVASTLVFGRRQRRRRPMWRSPWTRWGTVLGFALGGFFDGILLHQILQWHHLLSLVPG